MPLDPSQMDIRIRWTLWAYDIKIQYNAWMIPPVHTCDIYIMEAVSEIGLTKLQLEQINACQMFLQITTIAKMTDHTRRYLLPQALLQVHQTQPDGLDAISTSTLVWPNISTPTTSTW